jgi:hypothetical protein
MLRAAFVTTLTPGTGVAAEASAENPWDVVVCRVNTAEIRRRDVESELKKRLPCRRCRVASAWTAG